MLDIQTPAAQSADGLSLSEFIATIPLDPTAILVYLFLIGSVVAIWIGVSRDDAGGDRR